MRCLILIHALAAFAAADDVMLHEERIWRGTVEARTEGDGEVHEERFTFTLVTRPPKHTLVAARLPFLLRETEGSYSLTIKRTDGDALTRGSGAGRLYPRVRGWVQPDGRYSLEFTATPTRATAKTTTTGMWEGRFTTWRTVTARPSLLARHRVSGRAGHAAAEGLTLEGEQTFVQRGVKVRKVKVKWKVERIDPVLRGVVKDHNGRPVAGLLVVATTTNPARVRRRLPPLRREMRTDVQGRFALPAFWAPWTVQVRGELKDQTVYAPQREEVQLKPDISPSVGFVVKAYDLARLPRPRLLLRHFRRDVYAYLDYMNQRTTRARIEAALLSPPRK